MAENLLEGKPLATAIKENLKKEIEGLNKSPVLTCIFLGENCGAECYCKSQKKMADNLGIDYRLERLSVDLSEQDLIKFIKKLNADPGVNGIIIQMPLPKHIDYKVISSFIAAEKDVEGMHPENLGKVLMGESKIAPCTASAVMALIESTGINLRGKEVVVVGHSEIVGKPLSLLLLEKLATTTVCHIGTSEAGKLAEHVSRAEILVVAVGVPRLIKGEWVKEGAVVIDVGINRVEGKIVGDVEFEQAQMRASQITPVPGGVGPLTVTMLMRNLVEATKLQNK